MKASAYISVIAFLAIFALNILYGTVALDMSEILAVIAGASDNETVEYIILQSRLPQALTAMLAGAGLSVSGLLLQTIFHNPLAGPSILGVTNGASLGVAIVTMLSGTTFLCEMLNGPVAPIGVFLAALIGAMAVVLLLVFLSTLTDSHLVLLIAGIMVSYLISSVITLLTFSASESAIQGYVYWGMGDFSLVPLRKIPWLASVVLISLLMCLPMMKPLNALLLGERYAANLGYSVKKIHVTLLLLVGIQCAIITALCGPISFIGLAVPHITRFIFRTDNFRMLLPMTAVFGSIVAMACNLTCTAFTETPIPLSAVTPLVGAPVVLYLFFSRKV